MRWTPSISLCSPCDPRLQEEVAKDTPLGGVYLFSERGKHLYVGRTKRKIGVRIRNHFNAAPDCPFAWRLLRESTGKGATYKPEGSRRALLKDPRIEGIYKRAKDRIRKMQIRYVHESDPRKRALLEIYVSVAARTRYNGFDES